MCVSSFQKTLALLYTCGYLIVGTALPIFSQPLRHHERFFRFLPADTVAALLIPNPTRSLHHLTRNPAFSRIFTNIQQRSRSAKNPLLFPCFEIIADPDSQSPPRCVDIFEKLHRIGVIALSESTDEHQPDSTGHHLPYDLAILADVDQDEEFLAWLLEDVFPALQAVNADMELGVFEFQGETLYRLQSLDFQVYYTMIDHTLLASMNRDALQRLVIQSRQKGSSATAQRFASAAEHSAGADIFLAVRLSAVWPSIQPWLHEACSSSNASNTAFITAFLETYQRPFAVWDLTLSDTLLTENLRLRYPRDPNQDADLISDQHSAVPSVLIQNRPFISDRFVSEQVLFYGARHINLPAWWHRILMLMQALPEAPSTRTIALWRTHLETLLQKPIATVFADIGTVEIGTVWYPQNRLQRRPHRADSLSRLPLLLIIQADAYAEIAHALQRISDAFDLAPSRSSFQKIDILAYQVPFFGTPQTLFHAAINDVLLFSWSDELIRDSIRSARYGQSLAEYRDYRSAAFPPRSLTRGYLSLSQTIRQLAAYWERQPSELHNFTSEPLDMPDALSPMTWATIREPEALLTTSTSPLGGSVFGLMVMWFAWFPPL